MARRGRSDLPSLTIRYFDSLTDPGHEILYIPKGFPQFLSKLTDMSAEISDKIKGVANPPKKHQGFTLSDGSWWYRIVIPGPKHVDANGKMTQPMIRGDWHIVKTHADFDRMCEEAKAHRAVIEVEHAQQRARDHAPKKVEEQKVEEKIAKTKVVEKKVEEPKVEKKIEKPKVLKKNVEKNKVVKKEVDEAKVAEKKSENTKVVEKKVERPKALEKKIEKSKVLERKEEAKPVNPSPFAIWEQWIWPPIIVDGSGTRRWTREVAEESDDEADD